MPDRSLPTRIRAAGGRFAKGNPGGPGRPRGAVSAAAAELDRATAAVHRELLEIVLAKAREGNLEATRMLWARLWPTRRGRPVAFEVPPIAEGKDVLPAKAAITDAVLSGEITADEAQPILAVIDSQRDQISDDGHRRLAVRLAEMEIERLVDLVAIGEPLEEAPE